MPGENTEQRKLAAIMFTDMVGYSALTQRNEALALELQGEHHGILRAILPRHQGDEIKSTGDGLLVEFPSALAAVQCAVEIQQALAIRNSRMPRDRLILIRIGIHLGDVVRRDNDVLGDGVNIAARIEPLADPGGVCISRAVFEQIENKVSHSIIKLNSPELKNISAKVDVFKLLLDDVLSPESVATRPRPANHKVAVSLAGALIVAVAIGVFIWRHVGPKPGAPVPTAATASEPSLGPAAGDKFITQILEPIRQKYDLPGIALVVVTSDGIKWQGVAGVRKRGAEVPLELDDQWCIGSTGGIMTSVLIMQLIERGRLRWDTTLGEVFPEMNSVMNPVFQKVTLPELLSNRAAMPTNFNLAAYLGLDVEALRLRVVRQELSKPAVGKPGVDFAYSYLGYIVAGAVVERVTGKSWERVVTDEVLNPLQMKSAGFGGAGTPDQIDQPWQHGDDGQPAPQNGPDSDGPPVLGPAGHVHCSLRDWAAFIQDQLRGFRGEAALLQPDSYQRLRTPPYGGNFALGWRVLQPPLAGGPAWIDTPGTYHNGGCGFAFADGHSESHHWMATSKTFGSGSRPIDPNNTADLEDWTWMQQRTSALAQ